MQRSFSILSRFHCAIIFSSDNHRSPSARINLVSR